MAAAGISLAAALVVILYWPSLHDAYRLDDFAWLSLRNTITAGHSVWWASFSPQAQGTIRPLGERLRFLLASSLFGLNPVPLHVLALCAQIANVLLVADIGWRVTGSRNAASVLKRSGVLLMTVPWVWDGTEPLPELYDWKLEREDGQWMIVNGRVDGKVERIRDVAFDHGPGRSLGHTREHFPQLHDWKLTQEAGSWVLVNQRIDGIVERFENLAFHGGEGSTLEMRLFSKRGIEKSLRDAGFEAGTGYLISLR